MFRQILISTVTATVVVSTWELGKYYYSYCTSEQHPTIITEDEIEDEGEPSTVNTKDECPYRGDIPIKGLTTEFSSSPQKPPDPYMLLTKEPHACRLPPDVIPKNKQWIKIAE